ncbi:MAG: alpha/beta hydrolase [Candidatus Hydrogenedentales bacterium]
MTSLAAAPMLGLLALSAPDAPVKADIFDRVRHYYADNNGVRIHYAALGEGPLVIMIHGFPDFWYSWRYQMDALSERFQVVAIDLRGYNLSDKPQGVENYAMPMLVGDVLAVMKHVGRDKAIIVGHDWGGAVAWGVAMAFPEKVEKLVVCDLPHPRGLRRELTNNPKQQRNSAYARTFQQEGAEAALSPEGLADIVGKMDETARARYVEAFGKSDFVSMLNYYKANYPREPYTEDTSPVIKVKPPVLMFHGLKDWALLPAMLNDTWDWLEQPLMLVTVPDGGHWVHHDARDLVSSTMLWWMSQ